MIYLPSSTWSWTVQVMPPPPPPTTTMTTISPSKICGSSSPRPSKPPSSLSNKNRQNGSSFSFSAGDTIQRTSNMTLSSSSSSSVAPPRTSSFRSWSRLLRILILEGPVVLTFAFSVLTQTYSSYVQEYLFPYLDLTKWLEEDRSTTELTYYHRTCTVEDQTAWDTSDLIIPPNMTPQEAMHHMNHHGASVYPNLLQPDTARELRDFILRQNGKGEDMLWVIQNHQRWSFAIQVDQHRSVPNALQQIFGHSHLVAALEAIMGPNPAVIELTGITSAYGAVAQHWHQDVVVPGSATKYARNFVPSYSLFIPLQNTTRAMGATQICPGSHMCAGGAVDDWCPQTYIPMSGQADNWPMGYGALVNQQTTHRGPPHVDPYGPERVLFIITMAPRPLYGSRKKQVETRMIGQGGSYSLHWTQWGHTIKEFANPQLYMQQPWRTLRSLGIYKPNHSDWGWDLITQVATRIANFEISIFDYIDNGGFKYIPPFLRATLPTEDGGEAWKAFVLGTLQRCAEFVQRIHRAVLLAAISCTLMLAVVHHSFKMVTAATIRLGLVHLLLIGLASLLMDRISSGSWARNVKSGRLFQHRTKPSILAPALPATLPLRDDILIFDWMQSEHMESYNLILDEVHPGNHAWDDLISHHASGYLHLIPSMQAQLRRHVLRHVQQGEGRRILVRNTEHRWAQVTTNMAERFCHKALQSKDNPFLGKAVQQLDFLLTETIFGYWRDTVLYQRIMPLYLHALQDRILNVTHRLYALPGSTSRRHRQSIAKESARANTFAIKSMAQLPRRQRQEPLSLRDGVPPLQVVDEEYLNGVWLQEGDLIEAAYRGDTNEWYRGRIVRAKPDTYTWDVLYEDGDYDPDLCYECVHRFIPYQVNEVIEMRFAGSDDPMFYPGTVTHTHQAEYVLDVQLTNGKLYKRVQPRDVRRYYGPSLRHEFRLGMRIQAQFDRNLREWYDGTITAINPDGTFAIIYDDGDFLPAVEGRLIRIPG